MVVVSVVDAVVLFQIFRTNRRSRPTSDGGQRTQFDLTVMYPKFYPWMKCFRRIKVVSLLGRIQYFVFAILGFTKGTVVDAGRIISDKKLMM